MLCVLTVGLQLWLRAWLSSSRSVAGTRGCLAPLGKTYIMLFAKLAFFPNIWKEALAVFSVVLPCMRLNQWVLKSRLLLPILLLVGIFLLLYFGKISD